MDPKNKQAAKANEAPKANRLRSINFLSRYKVVGSRDKTGS